MTPQQEEPGNQRLRQDVNRVAIGERERAGETSRFIHYAVDHTADAAYWMGADARFIYVNKAACETLGYTREELLSMTVHDIDPEFPESVWAKHWQELRESRSLTVETVHKTKEGREIPVEITANYVEFDGREYNCAFARNITERKRAEEALRQYEHIVSSSTDMLALLDENFTYLAANSAYLAAFGLSCEQLIGCSVQEILGEDYFKKIIRPHAVRCLAGKVINFQGWFEFPAYEPRYMDITYSPYVGLDQKVRGFMVNGRNITGRKQAEDKLEQYAAELERSNKELGHFAYMASHDLQEPLRTISSYVKLLERRYKGRLDSDADEFIAFATEGADRLQQMIEGMLAYSRVRTRGRDFSPIATEELLEQVEAGLEAAIRETGARVTHDPLPNIYGDTTQLSQLFLNLLSNALKFHGQAPPDIHLSARREGESWLFSVADHGIGMDPGNAPDIFDVFRRLHPIGDYPGTGMGLAVSKRIVERHGGRIWMESKPGEGSTFYFTLPAQGDPN